jgi:hypothetical protein
MMWEKEKGRVGSRALFDDEKGVSYDNNGVVDRKDEVYD